MTTLSTTKKSACLLNLENGDIMKESIERLLKEGVEVIAIDNNSKDSSREVLKAFVYGTLQRVTNWKPKKQSKKLTSDQYYKRYVKKYEK